MYAISDLASKFGLSRSTLLYYERIGLLKASGRERNNYRYYTDKDAAVLEQIRTYRQAGLKLDDINRLLQSGREGIAGILERRLAELNDEAAALRDQQRFIISLLQQPEILSDEEGAMNNKRWIGIMKSAGFSDAEMLRWHCDFECRAPEDHRRFLGRLGLSEPEIESIRAWSATGSSAAANSESAGAMNSGYPSNDFK